MTTSPQLPLVLLTFGEVGQVLRLGRTKISELIKSGEIPTVPFGKSRRVYLVDLLEVIESRREWAPGSVAERVAEIRHALEPAQ